MLKQRSLVVRPEHVHLRERLLCEPPLEERPNDAEHRGHIDDDEPRRPAGERAGALSACKQMQGGGARTYVSG